MALIQWLCDDPARAIFVGIAAVILFALLQLFLCTKMKRKLWKNAPAMGLALIGAFVILIALNPWNARSDGLANLHWLLALVLAIPVVAAFVGLAIGWIISLLLKRRTRACQQPED